MHAEDLMSHPAITVHANDPMTTAVQKMWDHDLGAIAVVNDEGKLTGMITDRDICMAVFMQARPLNEVLIHSAMASHVVAVRPDQSIEEVEQLMAKHQIRRLPVVDEANVPIGMISLNDLALESVRRNSRIAQGPAKIARTLAAICEPRTEKKQHAA